MFAVKLLTNQWLLAIVTLFSTCRAFSHFTFHVSLEVFYYNGSYSNAVNNVLTSYVKFCCAYVNFKRTNQSCSPEKLTSQSMANSALVIEMVAIYSVRARVVCFAALWDNFLGFKPKNTPIPIYTQF